MGKSYKDILKYEDDYFAAKKSCKSNDRRQRRNSSTLRTSVLASSNSIESIMAPVKRCPYCGNKMSLKKESELFKEATYNTHHYFVCDNPECDCYCQAEYSKKYDCYIPKSLPADSKLRAYRVEAHKYMNQAVELGIFDSEHAMYSWLQDKFSYRNYNDAHMSRFDLGNCIKTIEMMIDCLYFNKRITKGKVKIYNKDKFKTYVSTRPDLTEKLLELAQ